MYASDNHYTCLWTFPAGPAARTNGLLKLESFTESNLEYKRAACPFSGVPMPSADGFHDFRLTVNPGSGLLRGKSLEIRHPGAPTFLNCPEVIPEGDDVMCTCQPSASSPPAVVTWTNGEDFNAVLQLQNLKLTPNGTSFTCNQYWGGYSSEFQKRITYTIKVEMRSNGVSALIAEVVGSVVVIVLLIVVSVLIWIKRCNPWYAKPRRGGQEQDSHTYSDLDSRQEESTDHPAGGATGLYNEAFEQEPVPPRARNPNTEPQLPADYIELIESEISATEEEQDQQSAHYIELTETQSAASGVEPNQRPAKHVAIVSHPDPASLGTQCENTTCKKLLTATESETGMKCESTDRKELLALNETSPDNTICKEVLALAETSLETQCENTTCKAILAADECLFDSAATQERRDADGYEIPIQNDNSTVCE
ncbi:uncharacterized protein [Littorina saxatilis]|uniref:uncharacterized protein n=1 Tax=Littorina saxatilis TaxID=31220 RepID=UPI0038B67788